MDEYMTRFVSLLGGEIGKGLPGTDVQWTLASSDRFVRDFPRIPGKDARVAAVLILLYPHNGSIHTILMQRPQYDGIHGGQISFPGGKKEPGDKTIIDTALREAEEETGIDPSTINVINTLTPLFIPVSNMIVTPVLAWTESRPDFTGHEKEVVFLFDVDLSKLFDPDIIKVKPMTVRGEQIEVRYYDYDGHVVWGATAMIIKELLELISRADLI
jgi:8-oxo-dGTP pyrophosphatase MutT (NUDIX family)